MHNPIYVAHCLIMSWTGSRLSFAFAFMTSILSMTSEFFASPYWSESSFPSTVCISCPFHSATYKHCSSHATCTTASACNNDQLIFSRLLTFSKPSLRILTILVFFSPLGKGLHVSEVFCRWLLCFQISGNLRVLVPRMPILCCVEEILTICKEQFEKL